MTTREGIIVMAVAHGANTAFDHAEQLETFFHAAQKQSYERAAYTIFEMAQQSEYALNWIPLHKAQEAIRALIEGEKSK